jgi:DNA repair helicase Rad25
MMNAMTTANMYLDYSDTVLRKDHDKRAIWVCPDGRIFLDATFSSKASDFCIAIADSESRPKFIHEYQITPYSLYAAASFGLTTSDIINGLDKLSKTTLSDTLIQMIKKNTEQCGKVKLVMKHGRYFVESPHPEVLQFLLSIPDFANERIDDQFDSSYLLKLNTPATATTTTQSRTSGNSASATPSISSSLFSAGSAGSSVTVAPPAPSRSTPGMYSRDLESGFIVSGVDTEEVLFLPGTGQLVEEETKSSGTISISSKTTAPDGPKQRLLNRVDQRKAMGMLDLPDIQEEEQSVSNLSAGSSSTKVTTASTSSSTSSLSLRITHSSVSSSSNTSSALASPSQSSAISSTSSTAVSKIVSNKLYAFEICKNRNEAPTIATNLKKVAEQSGYPMLEEYDFRRDTYTPRLPVEFRVSTSLREHQEKSLSKMFGSQRARSGIIVLPPGAGKTLVGITAMATIQKSTLIITSRTFAVSQWKSQIKKWTKLDDQHVFEFTASAKCSDQEMELLRQESVPKVVVTTYSMAGGAKIVKSKQRFSKTRSEEMMDMIRSQEWGLVILDEVHVAPAETFKRCVTKTHSRCKLGLTATPVREDDKFQSLYAMIGPKLFEANWRELQEKDVIAKVQCLEVRCPMTPEFYEAYLNPSANYAGVKRKELLYVTNPNKFLVLEELVKLHEERDDKIMIFSHSLTPLLAFQSYLSKQSSSKSGKEESMSIGNVKNREAVYGGVNEKRKAEIYREFGRRGSPVKTIFISSVGNDSIDLPETNVIIQVSSHFGSRTQEAQRLGRILRKKEDSSDGYNAFFYTLISEDTQEVKYASKRQTYLVDQGYAFKILKMGIDIKVANNLPSPHLSSKSEQIKLLNRLLEVDIASLDQRNPNDEDEDEMQGQDEDDENESSQRQDGSSTAVSFRRNTGNLSLLTGANDRKYDEVIKKPDSKKQRKN